MANTKQCIHPIGAHKTHSEEQVVHGFTPTAFSAEPTPITAGETELRSAQVIVTTCGLCGIKVSERLA